MTDSTLATLRAVLGQIRGGSDPEVAQILENRDAVFARYQPIFSPGHLPQLTAEEFHSFLLFENNRHWVGLQRLSSRVMEDMDALREALLVLVDESRPLEDRLRELRPRNEDGKVRYLGRSIMTPILLVAYPSKYGVWNRVSEAGLQKVGRWPTMERGDDFATKYRKINSVLQELSTALEIDLWTLDALWWSITRSADEIDEDDALELAEEDKAGRFKLEEFLQNFLVENWNETAIGQNWILLEEDGELVGSKYRTGEVGEIDLLARHRSDDRWLVIELKAGRPSDRAVGQLLRYKGWVTRNLANGARVEGLIICHEAHLRLLYAASAAPDVRIFTYKVSFSLNEAAQP